MLWTIREIISALLALAVIVIVQILLLKLKWSIITNTVLDVLEERGYGKLTWWKNK